MLREVDKREATRLADSLSIHLCHVTHDSTLQCGTRVIFNTFRSLSPVISMYSILFSCYYLISITVPCLYCHYLGRIKLILILISITQLLSEQQYVDTSKCVVPFEDGGSIYTCPFF